MRYALTHTHMSAALAGLLSDPCCSSTAHAIQTLDDTQRLCLACVYLRAYVGVCVREGHVRPDTPLAVSEGSELREGPQHRGPLIPSTKHPSNKEAEY